MTVSPLRSAQPYRRDVTYCAEYQDACYTFERALAADPELERIEITGTRVSITFVRRAVSSETGA